MKLETLSNTLNVLFIDDYKSIQKFSICKKIKESNQSFLSDIGNFIN